VDFTGCLAHAEITYVVETQKILRIRGYFEHNSLCKVAVLQRIPSLPLYPDVFRVALAQMTSGVPLSSIQANNRSWVMSGGGGTIPKHGKDWIYRYLLQAHDTRSINLHEWLDPSSSQYNPTLASAVFHYSARATKGDRLEVCISNDEMKDAAWKYGYRSQIILDGTFGISCFSLLLRTVGKQTVFSRI